VVVESLKAKTVLLCKKIQKLPKNSETYVEALEQIVELHHNLIYDKARYFSEMGSGLFEDLCATGKLGLMEAAIRYDCNRNIEFSTFAMNTIIGLMYNFINKTKPIPIKANDVGAYLAAKRGEEQYNGENIHPSIKMLAQENVFTSYDNINLEFDEVTNNSDVTENEVKIQLVESTSNTYEVEEKALNKNFSDKCFSHMSKRDREFLSDIFIKKMKQKDVAIKFGISAARVSQLKNKLLGEIRTIFIHADNLNRKIKMS
jgi:RNA polymerase sigma factor (sigma-70 family)